MSEIWASPLLQTAASLAAAGRYAAASRLLDAGKPGVDVLLLRAKMAAQQGLYHQAIAHWQEVLEMSPDHPEAQQGMALARQLQGIRGNFFYLRANLVYLLLLVLVAALAVSLLAQRSCGRGSADLAALRVAVESTEHRLRAVERRALAQPTPESPDGLAEVRIALSGTRLQKTGNELVVRFEEGLFQRGARLRPEGQGLLTDLAHQLAPWAGRLSIQVQGSTDGTPVPAVGPYRDNAALALARAVAVAEHLRAAAPLPSATISVVGLGEIGAPYPNDTAANRARNRTAVVRLTALP